MFRSFEFPYEAVVPDIPTLQQLLQTPDPESYASVKEIVDKTLSLLLQLSGAKGGYTLLPCHETDLLNGTVVCSHGPIQTGKRICGYMNGASDIALFICTAGPIFTELSHEYQQNGDFLEAYVVETIGSAIAENTMDRIQLLLEEACGEQGKKITNRYSPGYCDWALTEQQTLFAYIGENPTGITLSPSCLMNPIKSVSGIIGIGKEVKKRPYGCDICNSKTCTYRHIKKNNMKA